MSSRGFGSVLWAGAVAGAALGFYLVSLSVASERAELEEVETRIALAQRDIRLLQTEIGTRGRLAQLERWNVRFIRLSAPTADQFVDGGFQLASMVAPNRKPAIDVPVVLAAAPVERSLAPSPRLTGDSQPERAVAVNGPAELLHVASYKAAPEKAAGAPRSVATKPLQTATADPLAPLPTARSDGKGERAAPPTRDGKDRTSKDRAEN